MQTSPITAWAQGAPGEPWTGLPAPVRRFLVPAACVPLALLTAAMLWGFGSGGSAIPALDFTVGVLSVALVPLLFTRYQLPAALALAVLAALSPGATPAATAMVVVVMRLRPTRVGILVAAAGFLGHVVQGLWRPIPLPFGWWVLCVAAVYAALAGWGAWARTRGELLLSLHERAIRAEREQADRIRHAKVEERARIAREMHDTLAHHLTLITTTAGALEYRPDADPETTRAAAGRVRDVAGDALVELRTILRVLRTEDDELRPAPGLADLPSLLEEAASDGVRVRWERTGEAQPPPAVELAAYRVLQETLTNARRHAPGSPVSATLTTEPGHLELSVVNGPATTAAAEPRGSGTGLVGLAERVDLLGGTMTAGPQDDGFAVVASIPWQPWSRSGSS